MALTLAELARRFGAELRGAGDTRIVAVAALDRAGPDELAYLSDRKYRRQLLATRAGAVVLAPADAAAWKGNALITAQPQLVFARIAALLHPPAAPAPGIHPSATVDARARVAASASIGAQAVVEADAVIGERAIVGPGCYVGSAAEIGAGTRLVGHVWIGARCVLGRDCL